MTPAQIEHQQELERKAIRAAANMGLEFRYHWDPHPDRRNATTVSYYVGVYRHVDRQVVCRGWTKFEVAQQFLKWALVHL